MIFVNLLNVYYRNSMYDKLKCTILYTKHIVYLQLNYVIFVNLQIFTIQFCKFTKNLMVFSKFTMFFIYYGCAITNLQLSKIHKIFSYIFVLNPGLFSKFTKIDVVFCKFTIFFCKFIFWMYLVMKQHYHHNTPAWRRPAECAVPPESYAKFPQIHFALFHKPRLWSVHKL